MICWGENKSCGVFQGKRFQDRCRCPISTCIRDFSPEERIMVNETHLNKTLESIGKNEEDRLREMDTMLAIKNFAKNPKHKMENTQFYNRLAQRLIELGFIVDLVEKDIESHGLFQFIIFANYMTTPNKNIVLLYVETNEKDVQDEEEWSQYPFKLTEKDKRLFGRGLTTTKGPLLCWIQAAEAWLKTNESLPINLRIIINGFYDPHDIEVKKLLDLKKDFFEAVDLIITSNNLWITNKNPMLTQSYSGYIYFELEVVHKKDSKEGTDAAKEPKPTNPPPYSPLMELCFLMNSLTDKEGGLLESLNRHVQPITQVDWDAFSLMEVGIMDYKERIGANKLPHEDSKEEFSKYRWCMPSISMHTVNHCKIGSYRTLHTPQKIKAEFSVKLVPEQSVDYVSQLIKLHVDTTYRRLKCQHLAYLRVLDSTEPLHATKPLTFHKIAQRTYKRVYQARTITPDTINTYMPIVNHIHKYCMSKTHVIGMPFCSIHMRPQQPDEGLPREDYNKNVKLFATMMFELAQVPPICKCPEINDFCKMYNLTRDSELQRLRKAKNVDHHVLYEVAEDAIDKTSLKKDKSHKARDLLLAQINNHRA